jgi:hypothetical protein
MQDDKTVEQPKGDRGYDKQVDGSQAANKPINYANKVLPKAKQQGASPLLFFRPSLLRHGF